MSNLNPVAEGSSFTYTFVVRNSDQEVITPDSAEYRIDCLTTKRTIRDWTSITPSTSMSIQVTRTDNAIVSDRNSREQRQLTIRLNGGTDTQFLPPDPVTWLVNNVLQGRSVSL